MLTVAERDKVTDAEGEVEGVALVDPVTDVEGVSDGDIHRNVTYPCGASVLPEAPIPS